jgi:1-deoxy-D-xylulose-5-phosphate reductoisomerase
VQIGKGPKNIAIFGSTGSIGVQTLDVISRNPDSFRAYGLTAKSSEQKLREQITIFDPAISSLTDKDGTDKLLAIAKDPNVDIVVAAMVGFAGLRPTIEAIKAGKRVCIANKETFVVAGELMNALALQSGAEILPIDSEHSAIAQCLVGEEKDSIKKIILTASGGPFRSRAKETFESITFAEALKHPNWSMGPKITIDSATLMNKGLEIIEAHWLFGVPLSKIEVVIHPQSVIHSMVEFTDGSVKAQLGAPDMHLPIQYALGYPKRLAVEYDALDLLKNNRLDFEKPDIEKFPCLQLAREAAELGGLYPCILNAANEIAVEAFLAGEIRFTDIPSIIAETMADAPERSADPLDASGEEAIERSLARIFVCDEKTRFHAKQAVEKVSIA